MEEEQETVNALAGTDGFEKAVPLEELTEGIGRSVEIGRTFIALFRVNGDVLAIDNECPHKGAPLSGGVVEDGVVYCPLHGWEFELATGDCKTNLGCPVRTYETRVVDGLVWVKTSRV